MKAFLLGCRNGKGASFAFCRIGQARENVVVAKLWKSNEELLVSHATGQVAEDVPDRDPSTMDTRLPAAGRGVDGNPIKRRRNFMIAKVRGRCNLCEVFPRYSSGYGISSGGMGGCLGVPGGGGVIMGLLASRV